MFLWYYKAVILNAITICQSLLTIIANEFSLPILFKTLFAPWRKDTAPFSGSLDQIFKIALDNLISRFIGFFVRFFTIIIGLTFLLVLLVLSFCAVTLLALLLIFPPSTLIIYLIYSAKRIKKPATKYSLGQVLSSKVAKDPDTLLPYVDYRQRRAYANSQNYPTFLKPLFADPRLLFIFNHLGITKELALSQSVSQTDIKKVLTDAAASSSGEEISPPDLFFGVYQNDSGINKLGDNLKLKKEDILNLITFEKAYYKTINKPSPLLNPNLIRSSGGIGRFWSSGYTKALEQFSREIEPDLQSQNPLHFEAHKNTISEIETILGRSGKHNVILVGEAGTGKRTVGLGFASRVILGNTIPSLAHHRVIEFNLDLLLSGSQSLGDTEERLTACLNEAVRAGNIILFVDNIERLFEQKDFKAGAMDLSSVLLPYLQRNDFQLIGTTTFPGYHKWIEPNTTLAACFEKIEIKEPSPDETLKILFEVALYLESGKKILILYPALKEIISVSEKYVGERKFPEKAIDLLDEITSYVINQKQGNIISEKEVDEVVGAKTKIPLGELQKSEKDRLINLESEIHKRLINQEEAVKAISDSMRRARAGIKSKEKPIGTFLFLGPTGVGKTECAKSLAFAYFGDEKRMLRFDMTEYQDANSIARLVGGSTGEPGILTSRIRENPFSLLLLDEIEKANQNVMNLFLQILDEGKMTDGQGREVDFKNCIIIATSNAGSEWIRERTQNKKPILKNLFLDFLLKRGMFRPEFLNRFDGVVAFRPLAAIELEQVVQLMIKKVEKTLSEKQIKITLEEAAKKKLAQIGFDPQFGARALYRVIQEKVENKIADEILKETLKPGDVFTITEKMIQ